MAFDLTPPGRARTNQQRVFQLFVELAQPLCAKDVAGRIDLDITSVYDVLKRLRLHGYLRFVEGSARFYEHVPGRAWPEDRRGRSPGSARARLRSRASRPISQITAARPK